ncbi:MAG: hypothetical protein P4L53_22960 [Candidatus Obscuribacterales bacterium]|nr:hypothetical protein [Candidatus Obscuribacterales bacterium]
MIRTSLAVIGTVVGLMVGTAVIAGHTGPPAPALSISDAHMSVERLPPFVVKPQPSKHNGLARHETILTAATTTVSQTAAPADPAVVAAPTATPATAPAAAPPKAAPEVAPPEIPPFLSTELTADHTKSHGGFLNFLRFVIGSVARFLSTAEENLWVIMFGVAGILFLTTGFWQFHAISESRQKNKEAGGTRGSCGPSGSCKTKGPCH